jgi:hypothetical protein
LENRAREFVIAAKDSDPGIKASVGFVLVKHGKILKDGCEVLPICFVPVKNGDNWAPLYELFATRVKSLQGLDWLGQFQSEDAKFYNQWFKLAGLPQLAQDYQAYAAARANAEARVTT